MILSVMLLGLSFWFILGVILWIVFWFILMRFLLVTVLIIAFFIINRMTIRFWARSSF